MASVGRRIAIANWTRRLAGGAERYLERLVPALVARGHTLAFWAEDDAPGDRAPLGLPDGVEHWTGRDALTTLRAWRPELIFAHGIGALETEDALLDTAPVVGFAHSYVGTCISGHKAWMAAAPRPCARTLGWSCLLHYYPHRCGGLDPRTMFRDYARQRGRLARLRRHRAIVTASRHMREEYLRHGFDEDRVVLAPLPAPVAPRTSSAPGAPPLPSRILWAGRMDRLKGGRVLLEILPDVTRALDRPVVATFAGDGPERAAWERLAARAHADEPRLTCAFPGWRGDAELQALYATADLLVIPSLWPEPFGLVGLEAAAHGVPAVAFASGGIPDWLENGVNGFLTAGAQPAARALRDAIVRALASPEEHARLSEGALRAAAAFTMERHVHALEEGFERALRTD